MLLTGGASAQESGVRGHFDYYVLSLSWSPSHCADLGGKRGDAQCKTGQEQGFVIHGLWPQFAAGGYPQFCPPVSTMHKQNLRNLPPYMPPELMVHQWKKHGSCSSFDQNGYLEAMRLTFEKLVVPEELRNPKAPIRIKSEEVRKRFHAANPKLPKDGIAVICQGGRLQEVRVCLDKGLEFRSCGKGMDDRCGIGAVDLLPVR
jgi:ribonuclease T2